MSALSDRNIPAAGVPASLRWAGYALGFSIGGFFDGILLHQVLQWHHLLSGLEEGRFENLRFQILADGLFHVLMYFIGGAGLWLLWRSRRHLALARADRLLLANALIGFGVWHIIDSVASHWLLGIHRIKMDSDIPLAWDLAWFFLFGVVPLLGGWLLRPGDGGVGKGMPATLAALTLLCAGGATLPPAGLDDAPVVVVFLPGITPAEAFAAIDSIDGRLVWSDPSDRVWAIDVPQGVAASALYGRGAMLVSGSMVALGCLDWIRA